MIRETVRIDIIRRKVRIKRKAADRDIKVGAVRHHIAQEGIVVVGVEVTHDMTAIDLIDPKTTTETYQIRKAVATPANVHHPSTTSHRMKNPIRTL